VLPLRYILLHPLLYLLTKSPASSIQSVLHTLFLPTPFKVLSAPVATSPRRKGSKEDDDLLPEEVLKPGALYSECAVVRLKVPRPQIPKEDGASDGKRGKDRDEIKIPEDDELGGELAGRLVWEELEMGLKAWEEAEAKADVSTGSYT
jgi:hypothetical protein